MQEEVNEKTISLCINGGKISAQILKAVMLKALARMEQEKQNGKQRHMERKQEKGGAVYHGKQSMEKLMKQNCQLSNIEVTSVSPPRYFVFFKAKDVEVMTAAFKEYAGKSLNKSKKPSVRKKLELAKEKVARHREREKTRQKERGPEH